HPRTPHRWARRCGPRPNSSPPRRVCLPTVLPPPDADGGRKRGPADDGGPRPGGRTPPASGRPARARRARRSDAAPAGAVERRRDAAGRHRPRNRQPSGSPPGRRAHRRTGRGDGTGGRRPAPGPQPGRPRRRPGDAQSGPGGARGPARAHAGRRPRMSSPIWMLAWRSLADRPRRSLLLLVGYGIGVAVMIALLSVGDALLAQARDRDLVSGGDVVLLPEGVDPSVLKVNGVTDLSFTIQQAGFITREILLGPRFAPAIAAAAPQITARQIYVRARDRVVPAIASAGIPSLDVAAGVTAAVPGAEDTPRDRAWLAPSSSALIDRIDRFHRPPEAARPAWAEWDYFNFVDPATGAYGYLTILAGGRGRGGVFLRIKPPGRAVEDIAIPAAVRARRRVSRPQRGNLAGRHVGVGGGRRGGHAPARAARRRGSGRAERPGSRRRRGALRRTACGRVRARRRGTARRALCVGAPARGLCSAGRRIPRCDAGERDPLR